jgi:hypothetical protein
VSGSQISFTGWEGLSDLGDEALNEIRPRAEFTVKRVLLYIEGELKKTLTGRRSGRRYKVSRTGRAHIASAEGEAPAVLFGALRNSVGHDGPNWDMASGSVGGEVGVGLGTRPADPAHDPQAYAVRLEYGGTDKRGVRIGPRPYMAPTMLRVEPVVQQMFEDL